MLEDAEGGEVGEGPGDDDVHAALTIVLAAVDPG
jgi:hypothetical protein